MSFTKTFFEQFELSLLFQRESIRNLLYYLGYFLLLTLILYIFLIAKLKFENDLRRHEKIQYQRAWITEYEVPYYTALDWKSFDQLANEVYFLMDYILIKKDIIPLILPAKPTSCEKILDTKIDRATLSYTKITFHQKWIFSMNQYIHLAEERQSEFFLTQDEFSLEAALKRHTSPGQSHLIYGISTSQIEGVVRNNTNRNPLVSTGIDSTNKIEKKWKEQFDVIVSLGYLETIGFSNSGEDLNGELDLLEMQRIRCLLNNKGVAIISLPIGWDSTFWNQRRIYGRVRLPVLLAGFEIIEAFYEGSVLPITRDLFQGRNNEKFVPTLLVLRKI